MNLATPFENAWRYQELIRAVVRRELAVRFRGSILGWLWAVFGPLVMLSAYTVIFFERRWRAPVGQGSGRRRLCLVDLHRLDHLQPLQRTRLSLARNAARAGRAHQEVDLSERDAGTDGDHQGVRLCAHQPLRPHGFQDRRDARAAADGLARALCRRAVLSGLTRRLMVPDGARIVHARRGASHDFDRAGVHVRDPDLLFDRRRSAAFAPLRAFKSHRQLCRDDARSPLFGRLPGALLYFGTVAGSLLVFYFGYRFFMQYKAVFVDVI